MNKNNIRENHQINKKERRERDSEPECLGDLVEYMGIP